MERLLERPGSSGKDLDPDPSGRECNVDLEQNKEDGNPSKVRPHCPDRYYDVSGPPPETSTDLFGEGTGRVRDPWSDGVTRGRGSVRTGDQ